MRVRDVYERARAGAKALSQRAAVLIAVASFTTAIVVALEYRARTAELTERVQRLIPELQDSRLLTRHLTYHVKSQSLAGVFLSGTDALSDTTIVMETAHDGVFFLMSAECPWTPKNYSSLATIAASGIRVVGLSLRDDLVVLKRHLTASKLPYPVIVEPAGALVSAIPKFGPPFLAVVDKGKVALVIAGLLDSADVADILFFASNSNETARRPGRGATP